MSVTAGWGLWRRWSTWLGKLGGVVDFLAESRGSPVCRKRECGHLIWPPCPAAATTSDSSVLSHQAVSG